MKKFVTILGIFSWSISFCQNVNPLLQSPNAASLGIYDKIDVSPFTGLANISIPVFSISEGDITISSKLQYYSGGVKPDQHPGWVGTNWSLSAGGQVTRMVNGDYDEFRSPYYTTDTKPSYYYNYQGLASSTWSTTNFMTTYFDPNSGNVAKLQPDEFMFSLPNGISGSFFLNHLGTWVVKSKSGSGLKVEVELNSIPFDLVNIYNSSKKIAIKSLFYKILITDANGFKYTFGNTSNSIEFRRSSADNSSYNENVVATSWYLTKVESPKGNQVTLNYVRKDHQYHITGAYPYRLYGNGNCSNSNGNLAESTAHKFSGYIITPSYLSQIVTSNATVNFQISESVELKYDFNKFRFQDFQQQDLDYEINSQGGNSVVFLTGKAKYYKLDEIVIKNSSNIDIQKFSFNYSNDPSKRLTLNFFRSGTQTSNGDKEYSFLYNQTSLPEYNTFSVDRWGYFNNNPFNLTNPPLTELEGNPYFDMNSTAAQAGILTKITYPTGGQTEFIYEPNSYSSLLQKSNNSIDLISQSGIGGGLRIKEVINKDFVSPPTIKKYFYTKQLGGQSSGILAGISRIYKQLQMGVSPNPNGNVILLDYTDTRPLNYTDGKEVVYSEVKEELADGSYTIFQYSNSESLLYRDKAPLTIFSELFRFDGLGSNIFPSSYSNPNMRHISMDLERGNLLKKTLYNSTGVKVAESEYTYNSNPTRFNESVRFIHLDEMRIYCNKEAPNVAFIAEYYMQSRVEYTYFPYLEKEVNFLYAPNGIDYQRTETNFEYETQKYQLVKKTVSTSNSNVLETVYKHPLDFAPTSPYNEMVNRNMLAPVVEEIQNRKIGVSSSELNRSKTNYQYFNGTSLIEPASVFTSVAGVAPMTQETVLSSYDSKGNLKQYTGKDGVTVSYLWGYAGQYPVAKIVGKTYDNVTALTGINVTTLNNSVDEAFIKSELLKLNVLTDCFISTFLYKPSIGISKQTDNNGQSIYYEYDSQNRLILIRDNELNVLKKFCYNYYDQLEDCNVANPCSAESPPVWVNTNATPTCELSGCTYTGYQLIEQEDVGVCSPTKGTKRVVRGPYNTTACTGSLVSINYNVVAGVSAGYSVTYTNVSTGATFSFPLSSGTGVLGCIPSATYNISITKSGLQQFLSYNIGCQMTSGTSAYFPNITVSSASCNQVNIENDL